MILACKRERLDPMWLELSQGGEISVIEQTTGGEAKVTFSCETAALHLKHLDNQPPIAWVRNRKCADAAILVEEGGGIRLHVVELKSKLTRKEWLSAKLQFEGMIANVIAALAIMEGPKPTSVVCHISYTSAVLGPGEVADPILLKMKVGGGAVVGDLSDWEEEKLSLFGFSGVPLRKIPRDPATGQASSTLA